MMNKEEFIKYNLKLKLKKTRDGIFLEYWQKRKIDFLKKKMKKKDLEF